MRTPRPCPERPVGVILSPQGASRDGGGWAFLYVITHSTAHQGLMEGRSHWGLRWFPQSGGHLLSGSAGSGALTSLALPLTSCGTLSQSHHLSGPQLPDLYNEEGALPAHEGAGAQPLRP